MENGYDKLDLFFDSWQRIDAQYAEYAKKNNLSDTEFIVLNYINIWDDNICTQKYLCQKTLLPKQTINSVVKGFLKKGLVSLKENEADRRTKQLVLTEKGRRMYSDVLKDAGKAERAAVEKMGSSDWDNLVRLLDKYASVLQEEMSNI